MGCAMNGLGGYMKFLRTLILCGFAVAASIAPATAQTRKTEATYKVALHVSENDPGKMTLTLNNVQNIVNDFKKSGQKIAIEVVSYGPGLHMFREDTSPVKARIQEMSLANPNVTFAACDNTTNNMAKAEKKEIKIISEAKIVPSGIVHLIELQRKGYAYVKP